MNNIKLQQAALMQFALLHAYLQRFAQIFISIITPHTWLVETQNKILSRIAILYYTSSVQVERQMGMRIFSETFYKNGHNF